MVKISALAGALFAAGLSLASASASAAPFGVGAVAEPPATVEKTQIINGRNYGGAPFAGRGIVRGPRYGGGPRFRGPGYGRGYGYGPRYGYGRPRFYGRRDYY